MRSSFQCNSILQSIDTCFSALTTKTTTRRQYDLPRSLLRGFDLIWQWKFQGVMHFVLWLPIGGFQWSVCVWEETSKFGCICLMEIQQCFIPTAKARVSCSGDVGQWPHYCQINSTAAIQQPTRAHTSLLQSSPPCTSTSTIVLALLYQASNSLSLSLCLLCGPV